METIQWHLKAHGVFLDSSDNLDLRLLFRYLEQIVGNIANMIMDDIYANLKQRDQRASLQLDPDDPVVNRIEQLLAFNSEGGASLT